jgi:hypothetical protein
MLFLLLYSLVHMDKQTKTLIQGVHSNYWSDKMQMRLM